MLLKICYICLIIIICLKFCIVIFTVHQSEKACAKFSAKDIKYFLYIAAMFVFKSKAIFSSLAAAAITEDPVH